MKIINITRYLVLFFILILFSGCATIIKGGGPQGINLTSEPDDAKIKLIDLRNGNVMANTKTPQVVLLPKSSGFFQNAKYSATFEKEGYENKDINLESSLNPWYIGNVIFGGLIGLVIVDPASGAMWSFDPEQVSVFLSTKDGDPLGFSTSEFIAPLSIEKFFISFNKSKYDIELTKPDNSLARLNEILEVINLYDQLNVNNKLPKLDNNELSLPSDIIDLKKQTDKYTKSNDKFFALNFDQQSKLKKLNRRLLEISYPDELPKKVGIALDKTNSQ